MVERQYETLRKERLKGQDEQKIKQEEAAASNGPPAASSEPVQPNAAASGPQPTNSLPSDEAQPQQEVSVLVPLTEQCDVHMSRRKPTEVTLYLLGENLTLICSVHHFSSFCYINHNSHFHQVHPYDIFFITKAIEIL